MKGVDHADQYLSYYSVGSVLHTKKQNEIDTFVNFVLRHFTEEGAFEKYQSITSSNIIRLHLCCKHQMTSWCISCNAEVYIEKSYALKL